MAFKIKNHYGFTLIELLVVISIISLLSSITWASINTAREKAQQAKILAEIHEAKNSVGKNYEDRTYELGTNLDHYLTVDKGTYAPGCFELRRRNCPLSRFSITSGHNFHHE